MLNWAHPHSLAQFRDLHLNKVYDAKGAKGPNSSHKRHVPVAVHKDIYIFANPNSNLDKLSKWFHI